MKILIINRHTLTWTTGQQASYLPGDASDRFLVTRTFGQGLEGYATASFPNLAVTDMGAADRLERLCAWAVSAHQIGWVVALHEKDMLLAARLREEFELGGMDVATTLRFRDKIVMKDTLSASGYRGLPRYRAIDRGEILTTVPWRGRTVVKSRWGVGSSDVRIVDTIDQANAAARWLENRSTGLEIEEFVSGGMYHCDSVVVDGVIVFTAVAAYVAQPGQYRPDGAAGSVLVFGGPIRDRLVAENERALTLLGMSSGVTHAEFFLRSTGELVFCEAAARPGGGGIDDIVWRAYGVNLVKAAVELQTGRVPIIRPRRPDRIVGVLGVYHSAHGGDQDVGDTLTSIPGVESYSFSSQAVAGVVRHCTDYAHKVIISAANRAEFDRTASAAIRSIRRHQCQDTRQE